MRVSGNREADRPDGQFDRVHSRILRFFPELVFALGGRPDPILAEVGLDAGRCEESGAATYGQWARAMELAAITLGTPDFGMKLARRQGGMGVYAALGAVMRNSRRFGDALAYVTAHNEAHSLAARVWMEPASTGEHVFLGHDIVVVDIPERRQAIEQLLLLGHLGAQMITGNRARARRVHFRHKEISDPATYRRNFGCDVRFCRSEDGVVFSKTDLACAIVDPDEAAHARATAHVEKAYAAQQSPLSAQVRALVMQRLRTSACSSDAIAGTLAVHPRTLHRRLVREGTSFQQIKDEVRRDYMLYYLQHTDVDLSEISVMLGFSEQSALSHFARHHFGASPSDIRAGALPRLAA